KRVENCGQYSSDLRRAKNTAEMIAKTCHIPEVIEVPDLKERHVGSLQGYYWSEIQEKEPEAYLVFFSSEKDLEIPVRGAGESFNQLCERSVSALEEIASKHKDIAYAVSRLSRHTCNPGQEHRGDIRGCSKNHLYGGTGKSNAGKIVNASINVVHITEKKLLFKTWSDISHLNGVGFLQRGFNGDVFQY
ncbi:hypothetical protein MKX01_013529, partial [Papaver californicum]